MGAFLGISAGTPDKSSRRIVSQLLASCGAGGGQPPPFAAKFVYNLMGPIFYELTMMAMPSDTDAAGNAEVGFRLDTFLKFLCFVYLESALQYEATEDVFDTLAFCDRFEVAELQEFCSESLHSLAKEGKGTVAVSGKDRLVGKRLCDCILLFLGGRIPFYFNEEELTLLHSVLIETILDVTYAERSEFDLAESGIVWLQRKLMKKPSPSSSLPLLLRHHRRSSAACPSSVSCESRRKKATTWHIPEILVLVNLLAICTSFFHLEGVNIFASGQEQMTQAVSSGESESLGVLHSSLLLCSNAVWTWIMIRLRLWNCRHGITLLLYFIDHRSGVDRDALKSIIAVGQQANEIIHCGRGP